MYRHALLVTLGCWSLAGIQLAAAEFPLAKQITNSLGMKLVRIEPGEFVMGTGDAPPKTREEWLERDEDESPAHRVKISQPFYLGAFEVTNRQYEAFDPSHQRFRNVTKVDEHSDNEPVTQVTWAQATDFCSWLKEQEKLPYRLPFEAEWEYACRAGTSTAFHTGNSLTPEQANFGLDENGKKQGVRNVGSYPPNAWGLHDMHGNVAEWCLDWYGPYAGGEVTDPTGRAHGNACVTRGWSWLGAGYQSAPRFCRSANRSGLLIDDANRYTGFRVVISELPTSQALLPEPEAPLHQRNVSQTTPPRESRDVSKPLFVDYAVRRANPTIPPETWGPIFSKHNHFSTVCVCPNGDVLAVWYTCAGEADRQLAQASSRLRAGSDRWEPASFFFGTPDVNTHAPVLLRHGQRVYHFCTQSFRGWDDSSNVMRTSDDSGATWSRPKIILSRNDPNHLSQPCSAIVLDDGTIALACDGDSHKSERIMLSSDQGQTWTVAKGDLRQAAADMYAIHPAIAPRSDGAILCFLRGPDPMPLLSSVDRGNSWEAQSSPFPGIGVGAKAAALRLASGGLLLLTLDRTKRLGSSTILALSLDDGRTWPHARKVPAPIGGYTSIAQGDDGVIYLIGSQLKCAACNEAWLREGSPWK